MHSGWRAPVEGCRSCPPLAQPRPQRTATEPACVVRRIGPHCRGGWTVAILRLFAAKRGARPRILGVRESACRSLHAQAALLRCGAALSEPHSLGSGERPGPPAKLGFVPIVRCPSGRGPTPRDRVGPGREQLLRAGGSDIRCRPQLYRACEPSWFAVRPDRILGEIAATAWPPQQHRDPLPSSSTEQQARCRSHDHARTAGHFEVPADCGMWTRPSRLGCSCTERQATALARSCRSCGHGATCRGPHTGRDGA